LCDAVRIFSADDRVVHANTHRTFLWLPRLQRFSFDTVLVSTGAFCGKHTSVEVLPDSRGFTHLVDTGANAFIRVVLCTDLDHLIAGPGVVTHLVTPIGTVIPLAARGTHWRHWFWCGG